MRPALFVTKLVSLLLVVLLAIGCGGRGRRVLGDGQIASLSRIVGPDGGVVESKRDNIRVVASPGSLVNTTEVLLEVFNRQFDYIAQDGWETYTQGVRLTFDLEAVRAGRQLTVEMPFPGPYDAENTMLAVRNQRGVVHALPSRVSPDGTYVSGDLDFTRLREFKMTSVGSHSRETLIVFTASRTATRAVPPLQTAVFAFQNGAFVGIPPNLAGKKVAVVVHGIDSKLADLQSLGAYLAAYRLPDDTTPYYDAVIGFQYSSNNPLARIGGAMASMLAPLISPAGSVDLFAHSMGNVVSRYAMETESLGANRLGQWIHHFVGLGGPHAGVPFANIPFMQTLTWIFGGDSYYCIKDLATKGEGGETLTPFLTDLNTLTDGPDYDTASYFTLSGSAYSTLDFGIVPVGDIINGMYTLSVGSGTVNDGLVAEYSAQSDVLARQSSIWQPGPTLAIDHTQLHTAPSAFDQIGAWIRAWGQE